MEACWKGGNHVLLNSARCHASVQMLSMHPVFVRIGIKIVVQGPALEVRRFDDQRIPFPVTDRIAMERRLDIVPVIPAVQRNDPGHALKLVHHDQLEQFVTSSPSQGTYSDRYLIGEKNELQRVTFGGGEVREFEYDSLGRITGTHADDWSTLFRYDQLGRLSGVTSNGKELLSSDYGPMDIDPVLEADDRTIYTTLDVPVVSSIFGSIDAIGYGRPKGALFGPIRFSPMMGRYVIQDIVSPDALLRTSLQRRGVEFRLVDRHMDEHGHLLPLVGDKPSSSLFIPPEYLSVNCGYNCVGNISLPIVQTFNGSTGTGPFTVATGETINLASIAGPSSYCRETVWPGIVYENSLDHSFYADDDDWSNNVYGPQVSNGLPSAFEYSYSTVGNYDAWLGIECFTGCDFFAMVEFWKLIEVDVCEANTVTITAPPHNPSPSDAQRATNFSFLTATQVSATATTDPPGGSISWSISPLTPAGSSSQPSSGGGPTFTFSLAFSDPPGGHRERSVALSAQIQAQGCASSDSSTITQDQRDIIRQEYRNHAITIPARNVFVSPQATANFTAAEVNTTAYDFVIGQPGTLAQSVRNEWNSLIADEIGEPSPTKFGLILSSGWRNPERNEIVGGKWTSSHQYGGAVDLRISSLSSVISSTGLSRSELWCLLEEAGDNVGTGIPEQGATQVSCNNVLITHVHVQS